MTGTYKITVTRDGVTREYSKSVYSLPLARAELARIASYEASMTEDGDYIIRRFRPALNAIRINGATYKIKAL